MRGGGLGGVGEWGGGGVGEGRGRRGCLLRGVKVNKALILCREFLWSLVIAGSTCTHRSNRLFFVPRLGLTVRA